MIHGDPEWLTRTVLQALKDSGQRAVLSAGWSGLLPRDLPENIFPIQPIPFSWLFPRLAAAVHHGGAGTTATCLSAGIPQVIVPFIADQPFWAQRLVNLGVAPAPIVLRRLSSEKLVNAISEVITNPVMRQKAVLLSQQVRSENGIDQAAKILRSLVPEQN
jgi:sterol 3beta-glucosyltransferase